jgi:hypothetical protein
MLLMKSRCTMSRLLLALVLGATTAASTGCYGTTGYVASDGYGYYDTYPYAYGSYTTSPYYYGTYYSGYRYPYYSGYGHRYYRPYYRYNAPAYHGHYYGGHHGTTVVRDHRSGTHYSGGYHARPMPTHQGHRH